MPYKSIFNAKERLSYVLDAAVVARYGIDEIGAPAGDLPHGGVG